MSGHFLPNPSVGTLSVSCNRGLAQAPVPLNCIFQQASTTRRSAGIPALMTGIMSANAQIPAFEDVMTDLISISKIPVKISKTDQTNLPQVHAMNSLKEVFKSSTLGKKAEGRLTECLELAAGRMNSEM